MIPKARYPEVRRVDIDEYPAHYSVTHWESGCQGNTYLISKIRRIRRCLGTRLARRTLVDYYRRPRISMEQKFVAAMIWGHEAAEGRKRDPRGPWKLTQMFKDIKAAEEAIRSVEVDASSLLEQLFVFSHIVLDVLFNSIDRVTQNNIDFRRPTLLGDNFLELLLGLQIHRAWLADGSAR